MALKIEDYAVIGDCKTAALIGRNGSIDWLCWPRFDSAACFAALLGECENGRWLIAPKQQPIEVSRRYRWGSLLLETEFPNDMLTPVRYRWSSRRYPSIGREISRPRRSVDL